MAGEELLLLAHRNLVGAFVVLPRYQPGGFIRRCGNLIVAATGSPVAFFNQLLPIADDVDTDSVGEAVEVLESAGLSWMAHLRDGVDDDLVAMLQALGLEEVDGDYPAMVLQAIPGPVPVPAGVEVVRVGDEADFDIYLRTGAPMAGADPDLYRTWLGRGIIDDSAVALLVGYLEGKPVAISMGVRTGGVIGVYNVGTVESARRRGLGWAMTASAIEAGAKMGASLATLQSSPMAVSMYETHGFERLFRYRLFHRPA